MEDEYAGKGKKKKDPLKSFLPLIALMMALAMGFFMSGGRLLAQKEHDSIQNQLTGGIFFIAAIISIVLIVGMFIFSLLQSVYS